MNNLIELAVAHLKNDAIERSVKEAYAVIAKVTKLLADNNNDLEAAAPYPVAWDMSAEQYKLMKAKHNLINSLVKHRESSRRLSDPDFVDIDPAKVEHFIETTKEMAAAQYDLFVGKLSHKIGEVTEATLEGNHVWGHSILTVKKPEGETQRWKTQQIVNFSKYGTVFNQWPTRKVK